MMRVCRKLGVGPALRIQGDVLRKSGYWKAAHKSYENAVRLAPDEPTAHAKLAATMMYFGDHQEASEQLRHALSIARRAPWFQMLAMCELRLGNLPAAKSALVDARRIKPSPDLDAMIADLDARGESGEATAGFYDAVYDHSDKYRVGWRDSPYVTVWEGIAALLKKHEPKSILDLGCGPGQFALCVAETLPATRYHGVDFSQVAIDRGRKQLPAYQFSQITLPVLSYDQFQPFDIVICTEVLEHIESDLPVLEPISAGTMTIFSVPNYDSFGHVRTFKTADEVNSRYGRLFNSLKIEAFPIGQGGTIWLAHGIRL